MRWFVLCAVVACSGDPATSSPATVRSESGALAIDVRTSPTPLVRGMCSVELAVRSVETGTPVDGLLVTVTPWMPAHAHGSSIVPTVTALGGGRYMANHVGLFMPGSWQLRITFEGAMHDRATPVLDVP